MSDPRHVTAGRQIPAKNYCDQPYIVKCDDGAWLCVVTTGAGREGQPGQHIITLRSTDMGRTWTDIADVEPEDGPEASYAVLLKAPSGRVFCFYNHNTDNMREVKADDPPYEGGLCRRVDSLGHFVFKYSDDHGRTWSERRYEIPVREMEIDRSNPYGGAVKFFWNVGKAFTFEGAAYVPLHKVGGFGHGFFTRSEGVLLKSSNLLVVDDPAEAAWETLPEADHGLRTPPGGGPIAEEQSFTVLSDGSFYVVYRTIDGHPACSYSRDGGRTWETPQYARYANGRLIKHPRAANFVWRCSNGKYLYWFHNHGGTWYDDRNPVWLAAGVEEEAPAGRVIRWSQPEVVLYDDDTFVRMSYPDLVEDGGKCFVTETQKAVARVHEIDPGLLEGLFSQFEIDRVATDGLLVDLHGPCPPAIPAPKLPRFLAVDYSRKDMGTKDLRKGFSIDLWLRLELLCQGQVLLDNRTPSGQGFAVQTTERGTLEIVLNDGRSESRWDCDPELLEAGRTHHVVITVDGGPKIITFVVDGVLCDGGEHRQFGWGRYNPNLRDVNGADELRIGPGLRGEIMSVRIYERALRTSEAVGNYRAGLRAGGGN